MEIKISETGHTASVYTGIFFTRDIFISVKIYKCIKYVKICKYYDAGGYYNGYIMLRKIQGRIVVQEKKFLMGFRSCDPTEF